MALWPHIQSEAAQLWAPLGIGRRRQHSGQGGGGAFPCPAAEALLPPAHRSLTGSPRSSSESHSPLYLHPPKCTSCGSQSPQHAEMCLHTAGPTFPEEMAETQSEYSDSSCGESLPLLPLPPGGEGRPLPLPRGVRGSVSRTLLLLLGKSPQSEGHGHLKITSPSPRS